MEAILDMYPALFHIDLYLRSDYKQGNIAFYSEKYDTITIYVDRVTDGVLAHEIAHAIINDYFGFSPPSNTQEILCQYVDAHLWQDY